MSRIAIEHLTPGLILTADAATPDGRVILPKGGRVEAFHLSLFKGLGIAAVEAETGEDEKRLEEAASYVRGFFAYVNPDSPAMSELFLFAAELVAHRLSEGWVPPSLEERLARSVEHLADVFTAEDLDPERIARHETELASFPEAALKLKAEVESQNASMARITALISQDAALSAKILKLANSPLYGFAEPVDSIQRAVNLIGLKEVSTLALGVTTINYFQGIPPELVDMKSFWRHSIVCGIFAKILAQSSGLKNPERFFIAGLLHDVGRLILFKKLPYAMTEALLYARENAVPIVDAEERHLGFDHTEVSRRLLETWRFPAMLADLINFHHAPLDAPDPRQAAVIHAADAMSNAVEIAAGRLYVLPPFNDQAFALLGLPAAGLGQVFDAYQVEAEQIISTFF